MKKRLFFFGGLLLCGLIAFFFWIGIQFSVCGRDSWKERIIPADSGFLSDYRIHYSCWGKIDHVTGVILHYTATDTVESAIKAMEERSLFVQLIIDRDGAVYQLTDHLDDFSAGATGGNSWGINIEIVGNHYSLLKSALAKDDQFRSVVKTVRYLSDTFDIPLSNDIPPDVDSEWRGIFSHEQVDAFHPKGGRHQKIDPGKEYMALVMAVLKKESP